MIYNNNKRCDKSNPTSSCFYKNTSSELNLPRSTVSHERSITHLKKIFEDDSNDNNVSDVQTTSAIKNVSSISPISTTNNIDDTTQQQKINKSSHIFLFLNALYKTGMETNNIKAHYSKEIYQHALHIDTSYLFAREEYDPSKVDILKEAQIELNEFGDGSWKIDPYLSTTDAIVLKKNPNEIEISFHGNGAHPDNAQSDLDDIVYVLKGTHKDSPTFKRAEELLNDVREIYPEANIKLSGFSMGGSIIHYLGTKYNLPTVGLNSFLSPLQKWKDSTAPQEVHRIVSDWFSSGSLYLPKNNINRKHFYYHSVDNAPNLENPESFDHLKNSHTLDQFLTDPEIAKRNVVNYKPILQKIGHAFDALAIGVAGYDSINMAKNNVDPQTFANNVSEATNPYYILGMNIDPEYKYENYSDVPFEARWVADKINRHHRDGNRFSEFDRKYSAAAEETYLKNKYTLNPSKDKKYSNIENGKFTDGDGRQYVVYEQHK